MVEYCKLFVVGKGGWGEEWAKCVEGFVKVEEIDGSPVRPFPFYVFRLIANEHFQVEHSGPRLCSTSRPSEIHYWFKFARRIEDKEIKSIDSWSSSWWKWWEALVPGRHVTRGDPRASATDDGFAWDVLNVTSSCGIVVIMMSLSWWGQCVMAGGIDMSRVEEWRHAVMEVTYGLEGLLKYKEEDIQKENDEDSWGVDDENNENNGNDEGAPDAEGSVATSGKRKRGCVSSSSFLFDIQRMNVSLYRPEKQSRGARRRQNKKARKTS